MEYNTTRNKLKMPEYGRNVQKMVENCMAIEDRGERTEFANLIVDLMAQNSHTIKDNDDLRHKLWDHLFIISDFNLDVDSPFPKPDRESVGFRPEKLSYSSGKIKYRFYGNNITRMIDKAASLSVLNEDNSVYSLLIANHLKKLYLAWNRDSVADVQIENHIKELSNGVFNVDENQLENTKKILESTANSIKRRRVDKVQDNRNIGMKSSGMNKKNGQKLKNK